VRRLRHGGHPHAVVAVLHARRPGAVARIGSILGEDTSAELP
jgi:hypothetical protein